MDWTRLDQESVPPLPSKWLSLLFLSLVPITALIIWRDGWFESRFTDGTLHLLVLVIAGVTIGRTTLTSYWKLPGGSWVTALKQAGVILGVHLVGGYLGLLVVGSDPQRLTATEITGADYVLYVLALPWVAVGEEILKALVGLAFVSLLSPLRWRLRLFIGSIISAVIFGYLHVVDYPLAAGLPISLSTLADLVILIYTRSLWPLMLAHFIQDGLNVTFRYSLMAQAVIYTFFLVMMLSPLWGLATSTRYGRPRS